MQLVRDGRIVRQTIQTGRIALPGSGADDREALIIVTDGLKAGDRVLRDNVGLVADGTAARLVSAPANTPKP